MDLSINKLNFKRYKKPPRIVLKRITLYHITIFEFCQYFKEKYAIQYLIGGVHLVKYQNQLWFIDGPNKDIYDEGLNKIFANDIQLAVKIYFYQLCLF